MQLLDVIFKHFDRDRLKRELSMQKGAKGALELITSRLAVSDVVASYNLSSLLTQYHPGSRQWMYDRVNSWLTRRLLQPRPAKSPLPACSCCWQMPAWARASSAASWPRSWS